MNTESNQMTQQEVNDEIKYILEFIKQNEDTYKEDVCSLNSLNIPLMFRLRCLLFGHTTKLPKIALQYHEVTLRIDGDDGDGDSVDTIN